jgi:hypothetical protein
MVFRNMVIFYGEELLAPRPTSKLEDHPLSAVRDCIFAASLHVWRPFLHPQPEDAPCRGDRDPLIMVVIGTASSIPMFCFENIIVMGNTSEVYPCTWFCEPQPSHVSKFKYRLDRNCRHRAVRLKLLKAQLIDRFCRMRDCSGLPHNRIEMRYKVTNRRLDVKQP